jgi:hypothetical protein
MANLHPVRQAADRLMRVFSALGFCVADNGENLEVETYDTTFSTWKEPEDFSWQNAPLSFRQGRAFLRTRLLPTHLRRKDSNPPLRLVACGRVYQNVVNRPMRQQIEGIAIDKELTTDSWKAFWQDVVTELFGERATVAFEPAGDKTFKTLARLSDTQGLVALGFTGPASDAAIKYCNAGGDLSGWVFVIDVDQFAVDTLSLPGISTLYTNDVNFLNGFACDEPIFGNSPTDTALEVLVSLGYTQTCGSVLYPDDAYTKMNMIQEAWDKNNQGYALDKPLGKLTALRTVIAPAMEEILGFNYSSGIEAVRAFEVGHIYSIAEDQALPNERIAVAMGAYGNGVTIDTFKADVKAFLEDMGIGFSIYIPNNMAIAYKWNECFIVIGKTGYLESNFGRINKIALDNHGIGVPAYFAQFELSALVKAAKK